MRESKRLFVTGGAGRLGSHVLPLLAATGWSITAPGIEDLDILDLAALARAIDDAAPEVVLHLAAYTDVAGAERDRETCWAANVVGTRNVASATQARLIHLSTDYVFDGERGHYREDDAPNPSNYYSLTKLVAEEAARRAPDHLIVRTSFKTSPWPHPVAFHDQYTSADYVDVIAAEIALLVEHHDRVRPGGGVTHVATERKSVYDLARRRTPGVQPGSRTGASVHIPPDVSLDTTLWQGYRRTITRQA